MSQEQPLHITRRRHLPTHLQTADTFQIGMFSFTMRQGFIVLFGCLCSYLLWKSLGILSEHGWLVVRISIPVAVLLLALLLAVMKIAGRTPEAWALIWLTYASHPKYYRWERLLPPGGNGQRAAPRLKRVYTTLEAEQDDEIQKEDE